jgi:hypothetical protein
VFTHIPLNSQDQWLAELARILAPGGRALITVAGDAATSVQLTPEQRAVLDERGTLTLEPDALGASHSSAVTGQQDVFQTREEVLAAFGRHFEIRQYVRDPGGQDDLLLRKQ